MGLSSNNNNKQVVMMVKSSGTDGHDWASRQGTKRQQHHVAQSEALKCPRCESPNTKFCYYNNYNKSQPRHFCRSCKRHWTNGGTLRNVPVGGVRKNKRPKTKSSSDHSHVALNTNDHRQHHQLITNPNINDGDDHNGKSASEILFQAMMMTGPPCPIYFSAAAASSSSPFESSTSLSSSVSNHNAAEDRHHQHHHQANDIVVSKSNNNVVVNSGIVGSDQPPWKQLVSSSTNNNKEGFGNYSWNFEDIDSLVSADQVHLPWESHYSLLDILKP